MGYMLERQWEAHTRIQDGFSRIVFEDGEEITVKNDGKTGIDFVEEYLDEMKKNYPSHLVQPTSFCRCDLDVLIRPYGTFAAAICQSLRW